MNTTTNQQYGLTSLLAWTSVIALISALTMVDSSIVLVGSCMGITTFVALVCWQRGLGPISTGLFAGFVYPACFILAFVSHTVRTRPIFNGQLYHEDGPEIFFLLAGFFLMIAGITGSIVGAIIGGLIQGLRSLKSRYFLKEIGNSKRVS